MKLQSDVNPSLNTVTAYGDGYVEVNRERHEKPLLLRPEGEVLPWPVVAFETLEAEHFQTLLQYAPEVVLFGTGAHQRFPHPRLTAALARAHVGIEVMATGAACRTYNILMSEGRRVVAVILPP